MKAKRLLSMIALILALAMCFAACGEPSGTPNETENPEPGTSQPGGEEPSGNADQEYDDTIVIDMNSEVTNFDPAYLAGVTTSRVACLMMDHLCYMDLDGNIIPRLAESWEANEDATVWTFHLRKDVKWHDGTPFVAADVKYNFDRIINPDVAALRAGDLACVDSVEAPDDYTVVFNLNTPVAAFITKCLLINPGLLAQPKALEEYGESYSDHVVGTGPYKLVEWIPGEKVRMEANPDFYLGEPATKYVEFRLIPDPMTALIELEQGNIDFLFNIPSTEMAAFENNEDIVLERAKDFGVCWIFLNVAMDPCNDINVRKAIAHAIDYETIYQTMLTDFGLLADSYLPNHNWAYDNPRVDELVLAANSTGDQEERKELYIEIQKIIKEDYVSLPFYSRYAQVGVSAKVEGFTHSAAIFDLQDVRVAK